MAWKYKVGTTNIPPTPPKPKPDKCKLTPSGRRDEDWCAKVLESLGEDAKLYCKECTFLKQHTLSEKK